jgi:hypothetical protein
MGGVGGRRVAHFGGSSFCLQPGVSFGPRGEDGVFLGPMNKGGFVAPVHNLAHGAAVGSGEHESLHLHVRGPDGRRPESVMAIAKYPGGEIAIGARGLPRGLEGIEKETGQKAPGTYAETSDGDERHVRPPRVPDAWPKKRRALFTESPCLTEIDRSREANLA